MLTFWVSSLPDPLFEKQIQYLPGILLGAVGEDVQGTGPNVYPCLGPHKAQQAGWGDTGRHRLCQP